jgi:hypothetical protein
MTHIHWVEYAPLLPDLQRLPNSPAFGAFRIAVDAAPGNEGFQRPALKNAFIEG